VTALMCCLRVAIGAGTSDSVSHAHHLSALLLDHDARVGIRSGIQSESRPIGSRFYSGKFKARTGRDGIEIRNPDICRVHIGLGRSKSVGIHLALF
jgi:hypothetical protein